MFQATLQTLEQLKTILAGIPAEIYVWPCNSLSQATIGQHTRHIIELFQCLDRGYENSKIYYDKRDRNKKIEEDLHFATEKITEIQDGLIKDDKPITVHYDLNNTPTEIQSFYSREVMYNLEHAIHHAALIKVALLQFTQIEIPESFGVAPSTLEYRKQCVQ